MHPNSVVLKVFSMGETCRDDAVALYTELETVSVKYLKGQTSIPRRTTFPLSIATKINLLNGAITIT